MSQLTVLADEVRTAPGSVADGRALVEVDDLDAALGWKLEAQGLCRGDVCVPVADQTALLHDGRLDLAAVTAALGRTSVIDADAGVLAVAADPTSRRSVTRDLHAPDFTLPAIDGSDRSLADWRGRKRLLVAFASW